MSDSDLQFSGKVKRQLMDKGALVTTTITKPTSYNFTTKNISIRANSIPVETKLDVKSITSSPTFALDVDFFSNNDGREDFKTSAEHKNEIKWQPPRYCNMYP